ncbi:MAG: trehalose-phosphatase [Ottowia sp.]|uniref:trehalose-phosphatase n=1 Tax=Ottowia sp. TaxID=1898956 RepID=UPI0039E27E47
MSMPFALSARHALFLDFDGTLAEIAAQPQAVRVHADVVPSLRALHAALGGALAIVTGRAMADADHFLAPLRLPVACEHGAHIRASDGHVGTTPALDLAPVLEALRPLVARHPGLLVEAKRTGLALHYRQAPHLEPLCVQALTRVLNGVPGAELLRGKCVLEIKPAGPSKGRAIGDFMRRPPFAGRMPLFMGDDVTDEAGFAAVQALGGLGVKVGEGATQAHARIGAPADVRAWLRSSAQALAGIRSPAIAGEDDA